MPPTAPAPQAMHQVAGALRSGVRLPVSQAFPPFSAMVLADPDSELVELLHTTFSGVGAIDVRYASSPADLLRALPQPVETGVGVICGSPHASAVVQLVVALRSRGWRRLVIACQDPDDAAVRTAIAAKVRCLIRRPGSRGSDARRATRLQQLSKREVEVLQAVADGHTNNQIGVLLGLSGLTVKSHLARIGRKTGTGDRAEMVAIAMRAGLIA